MAGVEELVAGESRRRVQGRPLRICLLGATSDTGNLGMSALTESAVAALARRRPPADLTIFDNGWGNRTALVTVDGAPFSHSLCGLRDSRRYFRRESLVNISVSMRFGGLGNPAARALGRADAVLDASGGDSFSDLYGGERWRAVVQPKRLVLDKQRPLVLLPQTYGPFQGARALKGAREIVRRSTAAWARDPDSFAILQELLADSFDPERHRLGVDMAFALESAAPGGPDPAAALPADAPVAGINVSGLLFNSPGAAARFGLRLDYQQTMRMLVQRLLRDGASVVLVPHVLVAGAAGESDRHACERLLASLAPAEQRRVTLLPPGLTAGQTKWYIARCDWFCGTRMHSTIAALASGVPAAVIAYSAKAAGVFAECGQRDRVVEARSDSTEHAVELLSEAWSQRDATRVALSATAPVVVERAHRQWDEILGWVEVR